MSQLQIRLTDAPLSRGRQLDLFDVLLIFARQKWLLFFWTVGGALLGLI
ncbi:MAG: hypothetical protein QOJ42_1097, partial [Acidobacteriaceae bacterium]|nr:hypothetical protein [Acidobacteriaceae bacterium]